MKQAAATAAGVKPRVKKKKGLLYDLRKHWIMWLMLVPVIVFFFIFNYIPMAGVYLAFTNFSFKGGLFGSPWVGMQNFKTLWDQGKIAYLTRNTVLYNIAFIFLGNFLQIAAAIVLSRMTNKFMKKSYQTIMFLPYFVSYVIVQAFSYALFNSGSGMVTMMIRSLTGNTNFAPYSTPGIWKYIIWFTSGSRSVTAPSFIWRRSPQSETTIMKRRRSTARPSCSRSATSPSRCLFRPLSSFSFWRSARS